MRSDGIKGMSDRQKTSGQEEKEFDLETSVFPLLDVKIGDDGKACAIDYKGTCFLVTMGRQHLFLTARHLLQGSPDNNDLYIGYNAAADRPSYLKVEAIYVENYGQDISFFIPTNEMKENYQGLLVPMAPVKRQLPIGQKVLVYGFANSGQLDSDEQVPEIRIRRNRYEGKVVGIEQNCPLPSMKTVYKLEIPSPAGMSGSPVMVIHKGNVMVAGYIIGEQMTNDKPYATATDFTPFVQIEKLLVKVTQKLVPKK